MDGMNFGSWMDPQGQGWTGIPGAITTDAGTVSGGASWAGQLAPDVTGAPASMMQAILHPTVRQVLFFLAVVLLVLAWQGHLRSMLD